MGWPKGVPRKPKQPRVENQEAEARYVGTTTLAPDIPETVGVRPHPDNDGSVELPDNASISITPGLMPALTNPASDPFTKFKTDQEHFAYRAINVRPNLRREREVQGWQPIPGSEFGDLVLAKIPKDIDRKIKNAQEAKTIRQTDAVKNSFKEQAAKSGVKTFEET